MQRKRTLKERRDLHVRTISSIRDNIKDVKYRQSHSYRRLQTSQLYFSASDRLRSPPLVDVAASQSGLVELQKPREKETNAQTSTTNFETVQSPRPAESSAMGVRNVFS